MTAVACHNLEFGRTMLDFLACGCSSNASFDRFSVRNYAKGAVRNPNRGYKARKLLSFQPEIGPRTKTPEALLTGVTADTPQVLDLKKESRSPASLTNLFEVVAEDLQTLNKNLQSMPGHSRSRKQIRTRFDRRFGWKGWCLWTWEILYDAREKCSCIGNIEDDCI